MKIMIVGANGMLGTQIVTDLERGYTELGSVPEQFKDAQVFKFDLPEFDITDKAQCKQYMRMYTPDVVINCAAYTNVDGCEVNRDDAFKANAIGPRNLAIACDEINAKLVHISTDYVFEGTGNTPKREYEVPNPISAYGKTKLAGEDYVRQYCGRSFIIRTAWLYGYNGKNFVKTMMRLAQERGGATVVNDQRGNPTNAADLSHHILKVAASKEYGVYHCTGNGECSWYDFACEIVKLAGFTDAVMKPCTSEEYKAMYPASTDRPKYSALDNMMLRCTVGDEMRSWQDALKAYFDNQK